MRRLFLLTTAATLAAVPAIAQITPTMRLNPAVGARGDLKPKTNPPTTAAPPIRPQPSPTPSPSPTDMAAMAASLAGMFGGDPGPITSQETVGPAKFSGSGATFTAYDTDVGTITDGATGNLLPYVALKGSNAQWKIDFTSTGKPYAIDCAMIGNYTVNYEYGDNQRYGGPVAKGSGSTSSSNGHLLIAIPGNGGGGAYVRFWTNTGGNPGYLFSCNLLSLG